MTAPDHLPPKADDAPDEAYGPLLARSQRALIEGVRSEGARGYLLAAVLIVASQWAAAPAAGLWAWAALAALGWVVFLGLPRWTRHLGDPATLRVHVAYSAAMSVVMGLAPLLLRGQDLPSEAVLTVVLCMIYASCAMFNAFLPPMLYAFLGPAAVLLVLDNLLLRDAFHRWLALGWAALLVSLLEYGRAYYRNYESTVRLSHANERLSRRLLSKTRELAASDQAKSRFLAAASHDLRQPMVTIGVLIGVLREQLASPAQQRLVGRVDEAVAAMEGLLAGLLDLSRLEAGGLRVAREPVRLAPLLEAVAAHEREAAARKGLRLRLRAPAGATVLGDAVLIEQVLRNLVANALRYTERGGVLVGVRRRGAGWRIAVWDTGRGIAPEQQARVFEDFVQLDNPQRDRSQGLGLGLAIVRRAAGLLGTAVALRSAPGCGSCFSIDLPAQPGRATAPGDGALARADAPALHGLRVALVEDDAGARDALCLRLQAWGAEVLALASPAELDARIATGLPPLDLLVTDLRLPGASGLDVVARVRAAQGEVPALIVTGNTAPQDLAELAASGLPVVHKPFRSEQLAQALRRLLDAR